MDESDYDESEEDLEDEDEYPEDDPDVQDINWFWQKTNQSCIQ